MPSTEGESLCAFSFMGALDAGRELEVIRGSGLRPGRLPLLFSRFQSKLKNVCLRWDAECVLKGLQDRMGSGCGETFSCFYLSLGN